VYYKRIWFNPQTGITDTAVRRRNPTKFDNFPTAKSDNTQNEQCVIDHQKTLFDRSHGSLRYLFHPAKQWKNYTNAVPLECFYRDYWNEHYSGEWDGKSVSMNMAHAWCKKYDVECYFLDNGGKMILSNDSSNHKERAMAGYFTDMHFYPIDEYSHLRRLNELSHHVSKPLESLPVPEFEKRRKPQTAYERKCMLEAENAMDTDGRITKAVTKGLQVMEEVRKWHWADAQHVKVDNPSNEELWEIINKCQLYILKNTDMLEFSDWAKFKHKTILSQNPEHTCIKGRNELKDRIRLLSIDEDEYEDRDALVSKKWRSL
jgi:hypothetical protein